MLGGSVKKQSTKPDKSTALQAYSFNVNMYEKPPEDTEELSKLVEMATERLNLYKILQHVELHVDDSIDQLLIDHTLGTLIRPKSDIHLTEEARRIDHISHFVLSIAYCRTRALRDFFVQMEIQWFKLRFERMPALDQINFISCNRLDLPTVSPEEKAELNLVPSEVEYKCKFTQAPTLLKQRKYFMYKGYLYIPKDQLIHSILHEFKCSLRTKLFNIAKTNFNSDQLNCVLSQLSLVKVKSRYAPNETVVTLDNVDEHAATNFPLCMRYLHEKLRETHYHKYFSRMQYGLFLKGIGLSLNEALEFWNKEFQKSGESQKKIDKNMYLFKHQYGAVGGMIDRRPYSCEFIISQDLVPQQCHGCPFKHWDKRFLWQKLEEYGIGTSAIEDIIGLSEVGLVRDACGKYFKWATGCYPEVPITHPNQYFANSCACSRDPYQLQEDDIEDLCSNKRA